MHAQRDFTLHFPAWCQIKSVTERGEDETQGRFVQRGGYALFVNQYTGALKERERNKGRCWKRGQICNAEKHYIIWRELCFPPSSLRLHLPFLSFSPQPKWLWQLTGLWPFHSTILSFVFPFRVMWFYTVEVEALTHPEAREEEWGGRGGGDQWAEHRGQHAPTLVLLRSCFILV